VRYLMLDKIIAFERGRRMVAVKNVAMSEEVFVDHFPTFPVLPGAFIVESFEQASRLALEASHDFRVLTAPLGLTGVKYRKFVRPGDQLAIDVIIAMDGGRTAETRCRATVDDREVACGQLQFALQPADPAHALTLEKALFEALTTLGR
jgi:3-hydroxyacyl-[acyl-carrier-protein] dehydratase